MSRAPTRPNRALAGPSSLGGPTQGRNTPAPWSPDRGARAPLGLPGHNRAPLGRGSRAGAPRGPQPRVRGVRTRAPSLVRLRPPSGVPREGLRRPRSLRGGGHGAPRAPAEADGAHVPRTAARRVLRVHALRGRGACRPRTPEEPQGRGPHGVPVVRPEAGLGAVQGGLGGDYAEGGEGRASPRQDLPGGGAPLAGGAGGGVKAPPAEGAAAPAARLKPLEAPGAPRPPHEEFPRPG